ncbi:hypothetical protein [Streptomyces sp. NRRL WC-3618]|uniref:hypothetical protein n=1 Tax=Streptomyces sp. NRRL WC-3618 TaxID=1519490 RepID=UPI000A5F02B9|nr:hypothetical protein [Streptomyces sp. NRRL WC-3618]
MTSMPVAGIRTGTPAQPADLVLRNAKIYADFAVLSDDYFAIPEERIPRSRHC